MKVLGFGYEKLLDMILNISKIYYHLSPLQHEVTLLGLLQTSSCFSLGSNCTQRFIQICVGLSYNLDRRLFKTFSCRILRRRGILDNQELLIEGSAFELCSQFIRQPLVLEHQLGWGQVHSHLQHKKLKSVHSDKALIVTNQNDIHFRLNAMLHQSQFSYTSCVFPIISKMSLDKM